MGDHSFLLLLRYTTVSGKFVNHSPTCHEIYPVRDENMCVVIVIAVIFWLILRFLILLVDHFTYKISSLWCRYLCCITAYLRYNLMYITIMIHNQRLKMQCTTLWLFHEDQLQFTKHYLYSDDKAPVAVRQLTSKTF